MASATDQASAPSNTGAKAYGWLLVAASVLATGFAFVHPQLTSNKLADVMREMAAGAVFNGWVHGILIALYLCLVAGFVGLARRLGPHRLTVVLGLVFYSAGVLAMISAAVVNGFALAIFASRHPEVRPQDVASLASSINIAGSMAAVWAGIGAVATSAAILAWSTNLAVRPGALRILGAFGILLGVATIAMLVSGTLVLNVHGFLLLVVSQAVWTIAVGAALIQDRL